MFLQQKIALVAQQNQPLKPPLVKKVRRCNKRLHLANVDWSPEKVRRFLKGEQGSIICLGGPLTNVVVRCLMKTQCRLQIPVKEEERPAKLVGKFGKLVRDRSETIYEPKGWEEDFAVVEKLVFEGRTVFILSGRGRNGVFQAANYLMKKWPEIAAEYKDNGFAHAWLVKADASDDLVYTHPRSFLCRERIPR